MAFASYQNDDYYVRVLKVPVSTNDKTSLSASDFNYEIKLPEVIDNVIGFKLVQWSFSRDVIPTFYPPTTKLAGNDRLDFRLTNPTISIVPGDFTVTNLPTKYFNYEDRDDVNRDLVLVITKLMQAEVDANPVWAGKVQVGLVPDTQLRSLFFIFTLDSALPSTKLTLLFASGPSGERNIEGTLGFDRVDVDSSNSTFYGLPLNVEMLLSPYPTRLRPSDYLDVFVDESPQMPMQRIFFDDPLRAHNSISTQGFHRIELDTERPPRRLDRLHIRIRYRNNIDPGEFIGGRVVKMPNSMTFHFFTLNDSNTSRPDYIKQDLSY